MNINKFEQKMDAEKPTWANDPVLDGNEILNREKLLQRAKEGCKQAIGALKAPPYALSALILDGKKII